MPMVSLELGLALPIPNQSFGSFKASVRFDQIDTDGDVEEQLKKCEAVVALAADKAEASLAQVTANVSGLAVEGVGLNKEFTEFRAQVVGTLRRIIDRVKQLSERTGLAAEAEVPAEEPPATTGKEAPTEKAQKEEASDTPQPESQRGRGRRTKKS